MHTFHNIEFQMNLVHNNTQFSWENYYAEFLMYSFLPKVDVLFEQWDKNHPNLNCVIEQIELAVDLENTSLDSLQKELLSQLKNQLQNINVQRPDQSVNLQTTITNEPALFERFFEYIKTGVLSNYKGIRNFKQQLLKISNFRPVENERITQCVLYNFDSLYRLSNMFYDKKHMKVAEIIGIQHIINDPLKFKPDFITHFLEKFNKSLNIENNAIPKRMGYISLSNATSISNFIETLVKLLKKRVVLSHLNKAQIYKFELAIVQSILQFEQTNKIDTIFSDFITIKEQNISEVPYSKKLKKLKKFKNQTDPSAKEKEIAATESALKKKKRNTSLITRSEVLSDNLINKENELLSTNKQRTLSTEKAGLVILHPFLKAFFKENNLLSLDKKITAHSKAVLLLHYLATGNQEAMDIELTLEKILLGIPLTQVVSFQQELQQEEMQLCEELLKATLMHWGILKNNSIDTLRDMFFKRQGTIQIEPKGIKINIEKRAQDILLNKIPWNISLIKMPWIDTLIHVDWET